MTEQKETQNSIENNQQIQVITPEETPVPQRFAQARQEAIDRALKTLTPREYRVLSLLYGLTTGQQQTDGEVAKQIPPLRGKRGHVTSERIRQIKAKALRKLCHPKTGGDLLLFLPLTKDSLGKSVWNINFGYELTIYPFHLDIAHITLSRMSISTETFLELNDKLSGTSLYELESRPLPLLFLTRKLNSPLSTPAQSELTQSLQKLANQVSTPH